MPCPRSRANPAAGLALASLCACFYSPSGQQDSTSGSPETSVTPTTGDSSQPTSSGTTGTQCPEDAECLPDEKRGSTLCDPCGVMVQTCTPTCTWSEPICEEALSTCAYWSLARGAHTWTRHSTSDDPDAPVGDVLAAFGVPSNREVHVLTSDRYHVLDVNGDLDWVRSGPLTDLHESLDGFRAQFAYYVPAVFYESLMPPDPVFPPDEGRIVVANDDGDYVELRYTEADRKIAPGPDGIGEYGSFYDQPGWGDPTAPAAYMVRDAWQEVFDASGFLGLTPNDICYEVSDDWALEPLTYVAYVTSEDIRLHENYRCARFFDNRTPAEFAPFIRASAPPLTYIGGIARVDSLYVFRGL